MKAKPSATEYSKMLICSNSNASLRKGTYITSVVHARLASPAHVRAPFTDFIPKMLPLCDLMLKLWNISAMDNVRKAIVVPSGLVAISHTPASI